ncbi:putative lipoprotein [Posidoniimonas polymericola]|uniref:Putative lipoprotein n=1 Tax=Posidoniimonas polymericola TaxID=2528002 RepID=A0A5C5XRS2_9BACT|nr:hypothetical protein [Posidoniimonas polymericola]TWT65897.1 putative lipoprotein [Posidoniimonas polymericola]
MKTVLCSWAIAATWILLNACVSPGFAAINSSGDVIPADLDAGASLTVGNTGAGALGIDEGSQLYSGTSCIARSPGAQGAVTVVGPDSRWENGWLVVGDEGDATLDVNSGGLVATRSGAYIAAAAGSTSSAAVAGAGSLWEMATFFRIGNGGYGALTVSAGGRVVNGFGSSLGTNLGGIGLATVTGAGSEWDAGSALRVGEDGVGTLLIEAGGQVVSGTSDLGSSVGSMGSVRVTGAGSSWTITPRSTLADPLSIGHDGRGALTIDSGAQVSSRVSYIGEQPGSTGAVVIAGAGSVWNSRYELSVGLDGDGELTIESGGRKNSRSGTLGHSTNAVGAATVTGVGSQWNNDRSLEVGINGRGELWISRGGLVSVGDRLSVDQDHDGDSRIYLSSGGMLALRGRTDSSLEHFSDAISGSEAIRFWDKSLADWAPLATATYGVDYSLDYLISGDLAGFTLLTVGDVSDPVPAPSGVALLAAVIPACGTRRFSRQQCRRTLASSPDWKENRGDADDANRRRGRYPG